MFRPNSTVRILVGLGFVVSAVALFTGTVSLGAPTTAVAVVDLVVGLALLASGFQREAGRQTPESH